MIKELNYSWTQDDIKYYGEDLLALREDLKNLPNDKCKFELRTFIIKAIIIIIAVSFSFFIIFASKFLETKVIFGILIGIFILSLIAAKKGKFVIPLLLSKKIKELNQKLIINSDSDKVFTNTEDGKTSVVFEWENIKKIYNTEKNILLFKAKNHAFLIPKRIFNSEEELNETWNLIQECYNKSMQNSEAVGIDIANYAKESKKKTIIRSLGISIVCSLVSNTLLLMFFTTPLSKNATFFLIVCFVFSFILFFKIFYSFLKNK